MKSGEIESNYSDVLFAKQVRLLYKNASGTYVATIINGAILAFVQSAHIATRVLAAWYGALLLVTAIRFLVVRQYFLRSPGRRDAPLWNVIYLIGTAAAGVVWGAAAVVLFPPDAIGYQVFVAFVLAGMSAGGISVLAPRMEACLAFLLPALLPLAWRFFSIDTTLHSAMGIMTLIFFVGMFVSAWNFHRSIYSALVLRFGQRELQEEIVQRRRAEEELFREKERLQTTLSSIGEGVALADGQGRIEYMNPAAERLCGRLFHEAANRQASEVFESFDRHQQRTSTAMEDCLRASSAVAKQNIFFCKAGKKHFIEELATPLYDRHSRVAGVVSIMRDVTEAFQKTEQLAHAAAHDALTGLPNRNLLKDRVQQAIARAQRKHENFALMFLDLDRFKSINDNLGHASGDALLIDVARRLTECVREEDTIARLGGDEFVVLLDGPTQEEQVRTVADKIRHALREPYRIGTETTSLTVSVGVCIYRGDGQDVGTLLCRADKAMYRAKQRGRDQVCM